MVDKTTPRLGLPVPYLTNPLKIDVGKLTDALTMLDKNAVMLTDWDITSDSWQKMGKISNLAQGKIAITLMVVTGTGFANIVMQTGDGSVTTVGDPARITVTAQTNLGVNSATILGGKLVEVAADTYEIWFNIAPSTAPRKWTGLLIAGNGATIDWTHSSGAQPTGGVALNIARSLTDQEIASPTTTRDGAVLTAAYAGLMGIKLPYFDFAATGDTITSHVWRVGETMRVKASDAISSNGFPSGVTGAGAVAWRIHCESVNEDRTSMVLIFASEGATPTWLYRITRTNNVWSAPRRMYASDNPPAASEVKAIAQMDVITTVINLNDRILPAHYGVVSLTSVAGAVAANNFPFDETGQLIVFPIGVSGGVTQIYIAKSGRIASRSYDGSVFNDWRKGAKSGANDDITSLKGLQGPLTLNADAVGDYDAVTLRQLKANSGGSGPTMNGVVNNFIGAVEWFNGSRAKLPAGYVAADGQLLQRSAYPDLAEAVRSGFLGNCTDTEWLNGSGGTIFYNRGKFSHGDTTTTFRVPDLNGMQTGSVKALFLRGSGSWDVGGVSQDGAPNITGSSGNTYMTGAGNPGTTRYGAIESTVSTANLWTPGDKAHYATDNFDASRVSPSYGRDGTQEVRPNSVVGIWIIRASGAFQSANTNFSVIAGDATKPGNNTQIVGGEIISDYQVGGVSECTMKLKAMGSIGGYYGARLSITNKSKGGTPVNLDFTDDGSLNVPASLTAGTNISATNFFASQGGGFQIPSQSWSWDYLYAGRAAPFRISDISVNRDCIVPIISGMVTVAPGTVSSGYPTHALIGQYIPTTAAFGSLLFTLTGDGGSFARYFMDMSGQISGSYRSNSQNAEVNFTYTKNAISDETYKHSIRDYDGRQSLSNIEAMELKTFVYNGDERGRVRRGVIAQQVRDIDPDYVQFIKPTEDSEGTYVLDNNPLLLDALCAIQVLSKDLKAAQKEIAALKA